MGRRSVKKPKQQFVTMEMFNEFCGLTNDFILAVDASLDHVETRLDGVSKVNKSQADFNEISTKNIVTLMTGTVDTDKRIKALENAVNNPIYISGTTKLTEEMLKNLKFEKPKPFCFNHETYPGPCNNCKNGTVANYGPNPKQEPKVSQWRNAQERCAHTLQAVMKALSVMRNIQFINGTTSFCVRVKCQNHWRDIDVNFNGTKSCLMNYYRRNGKFELKEFLNTTEAAAEIVAIVMYYATR